MSHSDVFIVSIVEHSSMIAMFLKNIVKYALKIKHTIVHFSCLANQDKIYADVAIIDPCETVCVNKCEDILDRVEAKYIIIAYITYGDHIAAKRMKENSTKNNVIILNPNELRDKLIEIGKDNE